MGRKKKYTTVNYYNKKRSQRSTNNMQLAYDRTEKGGFMKLNTSKPFILLDRRDKI